ncbi:MAG: ABC transporter substrate-binding protein [Treponema sp.]|jgi:iron complex transport system substrate-binding protein|nr:ABC transporter substrate-binding protein [Treponema sp.]
MKNLILPLGLIFAAGIFGACTGKSAENSTAPESLSREASEPAVWPRTYRDAAGNDVTLEKPPERVALLFFHHYEVVLALGTSLAAATDVEVFEGWGSLRPYAEERDLIDLGGTRSPNLEKIMETEPDLIIYSASVHEKIGESLQKIAPAVAVGGGPASADPLWGTWQGTLREYGKILGRERKAEEEILRLEGLVRDAREKLAPLGDKTLVFIRPQEKLIYRWMPDYAFSSQGGLGLKSPAEKSDQSSQGNQAGSQLSLESLAEMNPDYIVLYDDVLDTKDEDMLDTLNRESSVWRSLDAVKAGRVFFVDRSTFSGGPLGMELGINTLLENITPSGTELSAAWPRTYRDAAGRDVTLEKFPQKIVVDYLPYWEYLMALNIVPAGASSADHYRQTWDAFEGYDVSAVADMGGNELSLERLVALSPDLIFIARPSGVENLEKIAPLIVMDGQLRQDWRYGLREFGKILGREREAEAKIGEVNARLGADKARLGAVLEGKTVLMLSVMGKGRYFSARRTDFYDPETGLGFTPPPGYPEFGAGYQQLSLEAIGEMDPDIVFLAVFDEDTSSADELRNNPVWKNIRAARDGKVFIIDGAAHATSIIATEYTIKRMVGFLLGE